MSILFTAGTPEGRWADWAAAFLAHDASDPHGVPRLALPSFIEWHNAVMQPNGHLPGTVSPAQRAALDDLPPTDADAAPWGGIDARACWTLETLVQRFPEARRLLLVEDPAIGLAAALTAGRAADPTQWLAAWRAGALRLLRQAQREPKNCLVVEAEEARRDPQALAAALAGRFGVTLAAAFVAPAAAPTDPLSRALGETLAWADADTQAVFTELQASCEWLSAGDDSADAGSSIRQGPRIDGSAAALRLSELQHALAATAAAAAEITRLRSSDAARVTTLKQQAAELQSALSALDQVTGERNAARDESAQLLQQLQYAQEALESQLQASRGAQASLGARPAAVTGEREADARRAVAEHDSAGLRADAAGPAAPEGPAVAELQTRLGQAEAVLHAAREEAELNSQRVGSELKAARRKLESTEREVQLLRVQLHQVKEELATYYELCRQLETAAAAAMPGAEPVDLSIGEVLVDSARNTPPHREINFILRHVTLGAHTIAETPVRLVEHHGRPGLLVFAHSPPLLQCWRETGREDARPYMLLVPSDPLGQSMYDAMDGPDRQLVLALAVRLEKTLQDSAIQSAPFWRQLARRLHEQLREMPRRFRHDTLDVEPVAGAGTLALRFGHVHSGARQLQNLTVHWQPCGPGAGLTLLCDPETGPPLLSWPDDEQGAPADRLALPLRLADRRATVQRCSRLSGADREFVLSLLSAWPGVVSRLPATALQATGTDLPALTKIAEEQLRAGRRAIAPPLSVQLRSAARRLLRPAAAA